MSGPIYAAVSETFRSAMTALTGGETPKCVLLAFSGGADSSLLLRLLVDGGFSVTAAHIHHGIRGAEADRDEAFCRDVCAGLSVPFLTFRFNVPAIAAERKQGLEETARQVRYDALEKAMKNGGFSYLLTAHNADDNAETVLLRLIRGTGLSGLCGIPPRRGRILRPLLEIKKETILSACREASIPYVTDSTNADPAYARNYLRSEILPRLKARNPGFLRHVTDLTARLSRDEAYLAAEADRFALSDGRKMLSELPDAILSRVLLKELTKAGLAPEGRHLTELTSMLRSSRTRFALSLPGGRVTADRDGIAAVAALPPPAGSPPAEAPERPIAPGMNPVSPKGAFYLTEENEDPENIINKFQNIYKFAIQEKLDSATIKSTFLAARPRRPGDVCRIGGMTRPVRKLLQSQKTSLSVRNALSFLTSDGRIAWIPGFPPADFAKRKTGEPCRTVIYFYNV